VGCARARRRARREPALADREQVVERPRPLLRVLDNVLHADPPAGVRVPSGAVGVDRDPIVLMYGPPDELVRVYRVPRGLAWKSGMTRRYGSKATHTHAAVPPTFTVVSPTDMRWTSLGSAPKDPRIGPNLCTHPHPHRDVTPAHDEAQGFRGAPQGAAREIWINRAGDDGKGESSS